MEQTHLSWADIEHSVRTLVEKIKTSGFKPDYLVGIAVGGLIPLTLISKEFEINELTVISANSYENKKQGELSITYLPNIDLSDKKVLLVDEIADTGATLKKISEVLINQYKVSELKTATLVMHGKKCEFKPDFHVIENESWIVFPWEKK